MSLHRESAAGESRQDSMEGMGLRERSERMEVSVADAVSSRYRGTI